MAELPSNDLNKKIGDQGAINKEIDAIDAEIAQLRNTYEQFFLGIERRPPTEQHKDIKKRIDRIKGSFVRQTALKFRINTLHSKFLSFERLWERTKKEIE